MGRIVDSGIVVPVTVVPGMVVPVTVVPGIVVPGIVKVSVTIIDWLEDPGTVKLLEPPDDNVEGSVDSITADEIDVIDAGERAGVKDDEVTPLATVAEATDE